MDALIGSTGFVGGHLAKQHRFDLAVHRPNLSLIQGKHFELLVCAGLPAAKWQANANPNLDRENTQVLASTLTTTTARTAVLVSTVDVYQPPIGVDESNPPNLDGKEAYGRNRAWFENAFADHFPNHLILRLPGLVADDLRKNLIFDLAHRRTDQLEKVNPDSEFQFFEMNLLWDVVEKALDLCEPRINITSEPIRAGDISTLFGLSLTGRSAPIRYDLRSRWASALGGAAGYTYSRENVLAAISEIAIAAGN
jgi:hypothetical protein